MNRSIAVPFSVLLFSAQFSFSWYLFFFKHLVIDSYSVQWPKSKPFLKNNEKRYLPIFSFQLDLVCDNKWWPSTSTSLFYVGSLIGNVLFGVIADKYVFFPLLRKNTYKNPLFAAFFRYGRRTSFFCLLFLEVTISIVTCFSPNYTVFTVLRTLNGVTFPALFQIPFILCK